MNAAARRSDENHSSDHPPRAGRGDFEESGRGGNFRHDEVSGAGEGEAKRDSGRQGELRSLGQGDADPGGGRGGVSEGGGRHRKWGKYRPSGRWKNLRSGDLRNLYDPDRREKNKMRGIS